MQENPQDLSYTKEHEWVRQASDGTAVVGITFFAQEQLGDIVYLDLPAVGSSVTQSEKMGEVESVKSVSDVFSPVSGEVLEANQVAMDNPEVVNQDPYNRGWLIKVRLRDPGELLNLLSADRYEQHVTAQKH